VDAVCKKRFSEEGNDRLRVSWGELTSRRLEGTLGSHGGDEGSESDKKEIYHVGELGIAKVLGGGKERSRARGNTKTSIMRMDVTTRGGGTERLLLGGS